MQKEILPLKDVDGIAIDKYIFGDKIYHTRSLQLECLQYHQSGGMITTAALG